MNNVQVEKDRNMKSVGNVTLLNKEKAKSYKDESKDTGSIKPGLMVHAKGTGEISGFAGKRVGTVDHLDGDAYIRLTKEDSSDQQHRWIPTSWVAKVDDKAVYLNKTEAEFQANVCKSLPEEMLNKAV